jgi:hypothetical protein
MLQESTIVGPFLVMVLGKEGHAMVWLVTMVEGDGDGGT